MLAVQPTPPECRRPISAIAPEHQPVQDSGSTPRWRREKGKLAGARGGAPVLRPPRSLAPLPAVLPDANLATHALHTLRKQTRGGEVPSLMSTRPTSHRRVGAVAFGKWAAVLMVTTAWI